MTPLLPGTRSTHARGHGWRWRWQFVPVCSAMCKIDELLNRYRSRINCPPITTNTTTTPNGPKFACVSLGFVYTRLRTSVRIRWLACLIDCYVNIVDPFTHACAGELVTSGPERRAQARPAARITHTVAWAYVRINRAKFHTQHVRSPDGHYRRPQADMQPCPLLCVLCALAVWSAFNWTNLLSIYPHETGDAVAYVPRRSMTELIKLFDHVHAVASSFPCFPFMCVRVNLRTPQVGLISTCKSSNRHIFKHTDIRIKSAQNLNASKIPIYLKQKILIAGNTINCHILQHQQVYRFVKTYTIYKLKVFRSQ